MYPVFFRIFFIIKIVTQRSDLPILLSNRSPRLHKWHAPAGGEMGEKRSLSYRVVCFLFPAHINFSTPPPDEIRHVPFLFSRGKVSEKYCPRENSGKWRKKRYEPIEYQKRQKLCLSNFSIWLVIYEIKNTMWFTNSIKINTFCVLNSSKLCFLLTKWA